jgi:hypothetical protein
MQINNHIQNISLNSNSLGNGATNPNYYYYYYINKANQQKQQQEELQKNQMQQASSNLIGFLSTPNLATQIQNNKTPTYIKHKQKITSSLNLNTNLSNSYSSLTNRSSLPSSPATYIATTQQSAQIPNSNNFKVSMAVSITFFDLESLILFLTSLLTFLIKIKSIKRLRR